MWLNMFTSERYLEGNHVSHIQGNFLKNNSELQKFNYFLSAKENLHSMRF